MGSPLAAFVIDYPPAKLFPNSVQRRAYNGNTALTRKLEATYVGKVREQVREQLRLLSQPSLAERLSDAPRREAVFPLNQSLRLLMHFNRPKKGGRPDVDNLIAASKRALDVFTTEGVWRDDGLIQELHGKLVVVARDDQPSLEIFIYPLDN